MERLINTMQRYDWGGSGSISALFGRGSSDEIEAELWMGAHLSAPSRLASGVSLADYIDADPSGCLGSYVIEHLGPQLPFLLKILSAARPLSIQAHPSKAQAEAGFVREAASGLAVNDPKRNYRDDNHKPELVCALTEFDALCGFRPAEDSAELFDELGLFAWASRLRADGIAAVVADLLRRTPLESAADVRQAALGSELARDLATVHPEDPGVLVALLLHRVRLQPFEALYLPAGNLHAYLEGTAVEVMASSDNVLRGGLTTKHVDVDEVLSVLDPTPRPADVLTADGEGRYRTGATEFELQRLTDTVVTGPAIVICVEGRCEVGGTLTPGGSAFVRSDETVLAHSDGVAFAATVPG